ncbi:MAG: hypothetical protein M1480_15345 [Bacteroidetes bacterium]|nr:hypothetical protein [Bacteroidota bacterium]
MQSKILVRIAAFLVLLLLIGHTIGYIMWDKPVDNQMKTVVQSMKDISAPFMGTTKSMADYYNGNSLIIFGFHCLVIILLWISSAYINSQRSLIIKILFPVFLLYLFLGVIDFLYFFPLPSVLSFLTALLILIGIFVRPNGQNESRKGAN